MTRVYFEPCIADILLRIVFSFLFYIRRMLAVILLAYGVISAFFAPNLLIFKVSWRFDPSANRSTAYLVKNPAVDSMLPVISGVLFTVKPVSILLVIICSSISIDRLKRATTERRAMRESHAVSQVREESHEDDALSLHHVHLVFYSPCRRGLRNTLRLWSSSSTESSTIYSSSTSRGSLYFLVSTPRSTCSLTWLSAAGSGPLWWGWFHASPDCSPSGGVLTGKPDETSGAVTQFQIMTLSAE